MPKHRTLDLLCLSMLSVAVFCSSFSFVVSFDLCQRVLEGEELDLVAIAVTPRRVYLFTTNFYVYDLPKEVNMTPERVSRKWPTLVDSGVYQSLRSLWSTVFFFWDDDQDYLCMANFTSGVVYGIGDDTAIDISNTHEQGHLTAQWSHLFLSGPMGNFSGVNNDPTANSTGILLANFRKSPSRDPPFRLLDRGWKSFLCYGSSDQAEVFMVIDMPRNTSEDACGDGGGGQPAKWLVSTGFVNAADQKIHMLGGDRKVVYIFSWDIMVTRPRPHYPKVPLQAIPYEQFFRCSQSGNQTTSAEVDEQSTTPRKAKEEPDSRTALIVFIVLASFFCLVIWIWLCVLSLPDCHWWQASQSPRPRSLRRPTVVKLLDSDAK
ncbi:hypothetical protein TYRP_020604 [Tyrophagus putrescentiae]|nr:hypothetical protein TYRP_020604 [Tyrophagus putrescentiae]